MKEYLQIYGVVSAESREEAEQKVQEGEYDDTHELADFLTVEEWIVKLQDYVKQQSNT